LDHGANPFRQSGRWIKPVREDRIAGLECADVDESFECTTLR